MDNNWTLIIKLDNTISVHANLDNMLWNSGNNLWFGLKLADCTHQAIVSGAVARFFVKDERENAEIYVGQLGCINPDYAEDYSDREFFDGKMQRIISLAAMKAQERLCNREVMRKFREFQASHTRKEGE